MVNYYMSNFLMRMAVTMKKFFTIVSVNAVLLLSACWSHADFDASMCFSGCTSEHNACYAKIEAFNDVELRDQRAACDSAKSDCYNKCDAERENDVREKREKLLQQPQEQPPQEQPQDQQPQDQQEQPPQDQPPQEPQ